MQREREARGRERERVQWGRTMALAFFCSSQVRTLSGGCLPQEHFCASVGAQNNKSHQPGDQPLCIFYLNIQHGPPDRFINDHNHLSKDDFCPKRLTML